MPWTKEQVKEKLLIDNAWLTRAVTAIHAKQTEDEKYHKQTHHDNNRGFNKPDAQMLSSFAEQINRYGYLTQKQLNYARPRMLKYAGQLARIANEKEFQKKNQVVEQQLLIDEVKAA